MSESAPLEEEDDVVEDEVVIDEEEEMDTVDRIDTDVEEGAFETLPANADVNEEESI
jgi:hypothetical protein